MVHLVSQNISFHAYWLFTSLGDVLSRLEQVEQKLFRAVLRLGDTSNTSVDESDMCEPRRRTRSQRTYKCRRGEPVVLFSFLWLCPQMLRQSPAISCAEIVARTSLYCLLITTNFATLPWLEPTFEVWDVGLGSLGLWRDCQESSRSRATAGEQCGPFRLERDREYPSSEDVIVDDTGEVDTNFGIFALIEVPRLGGFYELVYQLWDQFTLSVVRVNVDFTWSRDDVLFKIHLSRIVYVGSVHSVCCVSSPSFSIVSSDFLSSDFVSLHQLGKITRELQHGVRRTKRRGAGLSPDLGQRHLWEFAWQHWIVTVAILIRKFQRWVNW